jgi:hypothetical protein
MRKVVITESDNSLKEELSNELKHTFGVDLDTTVGKKTKFLIIREKPR